MSEPFNPRPIDTSHIELPSSLVLLIEELAKNTHDVWARGRIGEGWTYGPTRDDGRKKHPCLVPYNELPESEKEYDRNTSIETLKAILELGYSISRK